MIEQAWAELFADLLATLSQDERTALSAAVPALRALALTLKSQRTAPRS